jgi:hypothetical protein
MLSSGYNQPVPARECTISRFYSTQLAYSSIHVSVLGRGTEVIWPNPGTALLCLAVSRGRGTELFHFRKARWCLVAHQLSQTGRHAPVWYKYFLPLSSLQKFLPSTPHSSSTFSTGLPSSNLLVAHQVALPLLIPDPPGLLTFFRHHVFLRAIPLVL